jgi:hypothetical protein
MTRSTITASVAAGQMIHQFCKCLQNLLTEPDLTVNLLAAGLTVGVPDEPSNHVLDLVAPDEPTLTPNNNETKERHHECSQQVERRLYHRIVRRGQDHRLAHRLLDGFRGIVGNYARLEFLRRQHPL